jgi:hypothetical protein
MYLQKVRSNGKKVGFVSGTVFSGVIEHFKENIFMLNTYTKKVRKRITS